MFLKFVMLLLQYLHLGEYPKNAALTPGRISLRIQKTDTHLNFELKSPKMIRLVKKKRYLMNALEMF